MRDKNSIEINICRVIPAKKWRVIRLITKVWEFPNYIPNVKEASVIKKTHNTIKTKWRILIDNIPMSWIEEDRLLLKKNTIQFKALEGDLQDFKGKWVFQDDPSGTRVSVDVSLKIDIPIIKDFANRHIKKLLTRNFSAILR